MSAISVGLSGASAPQDTSDRMIVTGLTDGAARPGDFLEVFLSTGTPPQGYAWGSSAGASDYGTEPILIVPAEAAGRLLHVSISTKSKTFATTVPVEAAPVSQSTILPAPGAILVQDLGPLATPALSATAGTETIILENT